MELTRSEKVGFWLLLFAACLIFWSTDHLPLVDLPQHAGQIAALRDMMLGTFHWHDLVELRLLTPYLLGYVPGALLALIFPLSAVLSFLLTIAFLGFVFACCRLRRQFDGDARLDLFFIPAFFGFAWNWGMLTFLLAAPLFLIFLSLTVDYARTPTRQHALALTGSGIVLFFAHGMASIFGCMFGAVYVMVVQRSLWRALKLSLPFWPIALLTVLFSLLHNDGLPASEKLIWADPVQRLVELFMLIFPYDFTLVQVDKALLGLAKVLIWLLPFALSHVAWRSSGPRGLFIGILLVLWFLIPERFLQAGFIHARLSMFLLPFYILLFTGKADFAARPISPQRLSLLAMMVVGLALLGVAWKVNRAAGDDLAYRQVIAQIEPHQRALYLPYDAELEVGGAGRMFWHYALWYQAEQGGWVDFNFAYFPPQIVHFKPETQPNLTDAFSVIPQSFNWSRDQGRLYRYFIMRVPVDETAAHSLARLGAIDCVLTLKAEARQWRIFERQNCLN